MWQTAKCAIRVISYGLRYKDLTGFDQRILSQFEFDMASSRPSRVSTCNMSRVRILCDFVVAGKGAVLNRNVLRLGVNRRILRRVSGGTIFPISLDYAADRVSKTTETSSKRESASQSKALALG